METLDPPELKKETLDRHNFLKETLYPHKLQMEPPKPRTNYFNTWSNSTLLPETWQARHRREGSSPSCSASLKPRPRSPSSSPRLEIQFELQILLRIKKVRKQCYYKLEYAIFSTAGFFEYNSSTRPINRRLYSGIFKDPLETKYKTLKNSQNLCFMLKVWVFL